MSENWSEEAQLSVVTDDDEPEPEWTYPPAAFEHSPVNIKDVLCHSVESALDRWFEDNLLENTASSTIVAQLEPGRLGEIMRTVQSAAANRISTFAGRYNDRAQINKLPVEILWAFFKWLKLRDVIAATHTCKHWRAAALRNGLLWNHINAREPRKLTIMLLRSKGAPLYVELGPLKTTEDGLEHFMNLMAQSLPGIPRNRQPNASSDLAARTMFERLLPHMHRVRALTIKSFWANPAVEALLSAPAPQIVRLSLRHSLAASGASAPLALPGDLFGGVSPHLRELSAYNVDTAAFSVVPRLARFEFTSHASVLLDTRRLARIPEVIMYMRLDAPAAGIGALLDFLPPPESVGELYVLDGRLRAKDARTGFYRDAAVRIVPAVVAYVADVLARALETLTKLRIYEPLWSVMTDLHLEALPKVVDLSIAIREDRTAASPLFIEGAWVPWFPALKTLRFMRASPTFPTAEDSWRRNPPIELSASHLAAFIETTGAKPAVTLQGVKVFSDTSSEDLHLLFSKATNVRVKTDAKP